MKNPAFSVQLHHQWRIFPTRQCASHFANNRKHPTWNGVKIHASPILV